jgi:superfamily I DNA and RNA helicase
MSTRILEEFRVKFYALLFYEPKGVSLIIRIGIFVMKSSVRQSVKKNSLVSVAQKLVRVALPAPSEEQARIISLVKQGKNIIANCVAGSGKTTTSLLLAGSFLTNSLSDITLNIANIMPEKRILLVTYNAELKKDTRKRIKKYGITNIDVHSFHSLALKYYLPECNTDGHLASIVRDNIPLQVETNFDIIILDETQDMTPEYYQFISRFLKDTQRTDLQFLILGDEEQCIYDFPQKGADSRFLTMADQLFESSHPWERCTLSISYRLTKAVEYFVNEVLGGNQRIQSAKDTGNPVVYIKGNAFVDVVPFLVEEVMRLKQEKNYEWEDFFLLAPSVKKGMNEKGDAKPIMLLENALKARGIPILIPTSDEQELTEEDTKGKFVFSSFHQSKGRERKVVILMDFSTTMYFTFRTAPTAVCPRVLKVACTRPMEHLYLWGEDPLRNGPLPFLNFEALQNKPEYIKIVNVSQNDKRKRRVDTNAVPRRDTFIKHVTELIKFVPERVIYKCMELLGEEIIRPAQENIQLEKRIQTNAGLSEAVSDLTGIAISIKYECDTVGLLNSKLFQECHAAMLTKAQKNELRTDEERKWYGIVSKEEITQPSEFLELANLYQYIKTGYKFRMKQILTYDWLTKKQMNAMVKIFKESIPQTPTNQSFEHSIEHPGYRFGTENVRVMGRLDYIDDQDIFEGKCVETLKAEHTIQLALYAAIWEIMYKETHGPRNYKLVNYRTGEIRQITQIENVRKVLDLILENSFLTPDKKPDDEFIETCLRLRDLTRANRDIGSKEEGCLIMD